MSTANVDLAEARNLDPMRPHLYRVERVRRELVDTTTLELAPLTGSRPAFEPGQFNMLYAFGVGEVAISISGATDATCFVHTVRDVGAVSGALAKLDAGATVGLRGPYGSYWPVAAAKGADVLFVAGGLGLAPLRSAIYQVLANRAHYGRVIILVGSRNPASMLYGGELARWRERLDVEVQLTVDHADASWHGHVGVVPALIRRVAFDANDAVAMVCGPELMMRFTVSALREAGVESERIFLSLERNMKCGIGVCGHCQFGPAFVCKDGPVMRFDTIARILAVREI
ncbi:MAG: FAD/NAD(P)-binding protein [Steroidobacteraceae bacterium]|jgi:NAD(P)H-flavin reductase